MAIKNLKKHMLLAILNFQYSFLAIYIASRGEKKERKKEILVSFPKFPRPLLPD
jgi:hypothetical protein